jgi:DNA polymerase V
MTPPPYLRQQFGIVMERTGNELRGISCIELEDVAPAKQQIMSSRSFGRMVSDFQELQDAVSTYTGRATEKLRKEGAVCSGVHVFVETNRFREQDRQYNNGMNVTLSEPTDDVRRITGAALYGLKRIFLDGFLYKKAGVMLLDLAPSGVRQGALFLDFDPHSSKLMDAMSEINRKFGKETVWLGSSGTEKPWAAIFEHKTPRYTTCWDELPRASF